MFRKKGRNQETVPGIDSWKEESEVWYKCAISFHSLIHSFHSLQFLIRSHQLYRFVPREKFSLEFLSRFSRKERVLSTGRKMVSLSLSLILSLFLSLFLSFPSSSILFLHSFFFPVFSPSLFLTLFLTLSLSFSLSLDSHSH